MTISQARGKRRALTPGAEFGMTPALTRYRWVLLCMPDEIRLTRGVIHDDGSRPNLSIARVAAD